MLSSPFFSSSFPSPSLLLFNTFLVPTFLCSAVSCVWRNRGVWRKGKERSYCCTHSWHGWAWLEEWVVWWRERLPKRDRDKGGWVCWLGRGRGHVWFGPPSFHRRPPQTALQLAPGNLHSSWVQKVEEPLKKGMEGGGGSDPPTPPLKKNAS